MAGRAVPESGLTPEERVDVAIASARYEDAGRGIIRAGKDFDTGGGGAGGQFVFADLDELDTVIKRWEALHDRIRKRGWKTRDAASLCNRPADDMMSRHQADAARDTMNKKLDHNNAMLAYAEAYVRKLRASRASMAAMEQANRRRLLHESRALGHG